MHEIRVISKAAVKRLRLRQGDIVLVKDWETARALMSVRAEGIPNCPVVVAPHGVHRLSREYLLRNWSVDG